MKDKIFSIRKHFGSRLNEVWDQKLFSDLKVIERGFISQDEVHMNALLFVGINPSFTESQDAINEGEINFYNLKQSGNIYAKYFGVFENIAKSATLIWTHIDLLYFRETNQKYVDELSKTSSGSQFIDSQLEISKLILEEINPRIIVVANTKARDFMGKHNGEGKWMNYKFEFDDRIGTDIISSEDSNLFRTPVFFTSMLSGQRCLDIGSRERLIWHIKKTNRLI